MACGVVQSEEVDALREPEFQVPRVEGWTLELVETGSMAATVDRVVRVQSAVFVNGVQVPPQEAEALRDMVGAMDWDMVPQAPATAVGGKTYGVRFVADDAPVLVKNVDVATLSPVLDAIASRRSEVSIPPEVDCRVEAPAPKCLWNVTEVCARAYAPVAYQRFMCEGA
jgi:hypothetical protein